MGVNYSFILKIKNKLLNGTEQGASKTNHTHMSMDIVFLVNINYQHLEKSFIT